MRTKITSRGVVVGALPPPTEFGAPRRYTSWREEQEEALVLCDESTKRFSFLNLPTGSGKSLFAYMYCLMTGKRGLILTESKGLADKYSEDLGEKEPNGEGLAVDVRGAGNYPCPALQPGGQYRFAAGNPGPEQSNCDRGPCLSGNYCKLREGGCPKYDQLRKAREAQVVVTNYANWLAIGRSKRDEKEDALGDFDVLFLDEAHSAFDQVSKALTVEFRVVDPRRASVPPLASPKANTMAGWAAWLEEMHHSIPRTYEDYKDAIRHGSKVAVVHAERTRRMCRDLDLLRDATTATVANKLTGKLTDWLPDYQYGTVTFQPIWPAPYCERYLFRGIPRIIGMSATLQPAHLRYIGLVDPSKYDFWEFESTFPTANRPFYYFPVAFMHYAMKESEKLRWVHGIDRIAEVHRGEKGLVHTVSFDRADYYANKTKLHGRRTMFGTPASRSYVHVPTSEIVAQFRLRSDAPVLVSPSLATGYDFPDDDARWQVVGKVPFPDKRGRLIQARTAVDPEYAPMLAMTQVVQAYGRIVRSMSDWGTTYMIDRTWETFYHKFKKFAPRWFQAVVKRVSSIPKGSAKLTARIAKANIERGSEGGDAR